jgi:hypothetical protein
VKSAISHVSGALLEGALVAALIVVVAAGTTFAARGGGKHGGGSTSGSSSLAVVMVDDLNGNGAPNYGDTITFKVTTTASSPYVDLTCSQSGKVVFAASAGFYDDFPWPGARIMPLESPSWTGGSASCKAVLNNGLATLTFTAGG